MTLKVVRGNRRCLGSNRHGARGLAWPQLRMKQSSVQILMATRHYLCACAPSWRAWDSYPGQSRSATDAIPNAARCSSTAAGWTATRQRPQHHRCSANRWAAEGQINPFGSGAPTASSTSKGGGKGGGEWRRKGGRVARTSSHLLVVIGWTVRMARGFHHWCAW